MVLDIGLLATTNILWYWKIVYANAVGVVVMYVNINASQIKKNQPLTNAQVQV